MSGWYVVHTRAGYERKAAFHLASQGFQIYLPQYLKTRRHARRVDQVCAPLFARYLFVSFDMEAAAWRSINGTVGVSYIVCLNDKPARVPDSLIAEIKSREDAAGTVKVNRINPIKTGERVQFVSGPLMDQTGIFECEQDEDRVVILLSLLGRPTRVAVPSDAIVSCA